MIVAFVIAFLIGVIVWAAASAIRDIRANENGNTMIVELEHVSDHRVFYDTETGVMYVEPGRARIEQKQQFISMLEEYMDGIRNEKES